MTDVDLDSNSQPTSRSSYSWLVVVGLVVLVAGGAFVLWRATRSDDSTPQRVGGRERLAGFGEVSITITSSDGEEHEACLLLAKSSGQRERGLMEVTDESLGGYDGMLFDFGREASSGFWMRNTPMPLSIAFFQAQGALVSTVDMAPCSDRPSCPSYAAAGPYHYAIEVPQGRLPALGIRRGSKLTVGDASCPPT